MKYSPAIIEEICGFIEDGLSQKDASRMARISESTFYEWIHTKPELSESLELARLKYKHRLLTMLNVQAANNPRVALEVLARKWPDEWGERSLRSPIMQQSPDYYDKPKEVSEDVLDRLEKRIKRLRAARNAQED